MDFKPSEKKADPIEDVEECILARSNTLNRLIDLIVKAARKG